MQPDVTLSQPSLDLTAVLTGRLICGEIHIWGATPEPAAP